MKRIICHPVRLVTHLCCLGVLLAMVVLYITMGNYMASIIFGALLSLSVYLNIDVFSVVRLDDEGATKLLFGLKICHICWSDVEEAGVIYTKLSRRMAKEKRPGACSLYLSAKKMTSQERLKASLNWPPRDVVEMAYSPERMRMLSFRWDKKWTLFNITSEQLFQNEACLPNIDADEIRY